VTVEQAHNKLVFLQHSPEWQLVFQQDKIYVFKRIQGT